MPARGASQGNIYHANRPIPWLAPQAGVHEFQTNADSKTPLAGLETQRLN